MAVVIKVFGTALTINTLTALSRQVRGRIMRIALNAGGGVIRDAAVAMAPKETGLLRKSLKVKVKVPELSFNPAHWHRPSYALVGPSRHVVGPALHKGGQTKLVGMKRALKHVLGGGKVQTRSPSRYAHLAEKGTKPHLITAKNARILSSGSRAFGRSVNHPGSKAQSFLGRAARVAGPAAQIKMLAKIYQGIMVWGNAHYARVFSTLIR